MTSDPDASSPTDVPSGRATIAVFGADRQLDVAATDATAIVIDNAVGGSPYNDGFLVLQPPVLSGSDLLDEILRLAPTVVHIDDVGGSGLLLDPAELDRVMSLVGRQVRCVVLSRCWDDEIAKIVNRHIDIVVGTSQSVPNNASRAFVAAFYKRVAGGGSMLSAFEQAHVACGTHAQGGTAQSLIRPGSASTVLAGPFGVFSGESPGTPMGGPARSALVQASIDAFHHDALRVATVLLDNQALAHDIVAEAFEDQRHGVSGPNTAIGGSDLRIAVVRAALPLISRTPGAATTARTHAELASLLRGLEAPLFEVLVLRHVGLWDPASIGNALSLIDFDEAALHAVHAAAIEALLAPVGRPVGTAELAAALQGAIRAQTLSAPAVASAYEHETSITSITSITSFESEDQGAGELAASSAGAKPGAAGAPGLPAAPAAGDQHLRDLEAALEAGAAPITLPEDLDAYLGTDEPLDVIAASTVGERRPKLGDHRKPMELADDTSPAPMIAELARRRIGTPPSRSFRTPEPLVPDVEAEMVEPHSIAGSPTPNASRLSTTGPQAVLGRTLTRSDTHLIPHPVIGRLDSPAAPASPPPGNARTRTAAATRQRFAGAAAALLLLGGLGAAIVQRTNSAEGGISISAASAADVPEATPAIDATQSTQTPSPQTGPTPPASSGSDRDTEDPQVLPAQQTAVAAGENDEASAAAPAVVPFSTASANAEDIGALRIAAGSANIEATPLVDGVVFNNVFIGEWQFVGLDAEHLREDFNYVVLTVDFAHDVRYNLTAEAVLEIRCTSSECPNEWSDWSPLPAGLVEETSSTTLIPRELLAANVIFEIRSARTPDVYEAG